MSELVRVLRRHRWMALLGFLIPVVAALVLTSMASATYEARAEVLFRAQVVDPLDQQNGSQPATRTLNNEVLQMQSEVARAAVRKAYTGPLDPKIVVVTPAAAESDVISLSARGSDPKAVAALVNTYVDAYTQYRRDLDVAAYNAAADVARQKMTDLQKSIDTANGRLAALDARIGSAADDLERDAAVKERELLLPSVDSQIKAYRDQIAFYQSSLDRLELSAGIRKAGALVSLRAAAVPDAPVAPSHVRDLAWGIALGLVFGFGAALLADMFDDAADDRAGLELATTAPVLASIPRVSRRTAKSPVVGSDASTPVAESFRMLRTALRFRRFDRPLRVVQVTGPAGEEGATYVAVNLAAALAGAGESVVLVDANFRRPGVVDLTGGKEEPGFTSVIGGLARLRAALTVHPSIPNLTVLASGPAVSNPSELLSSDAAGAVVAELATSYDWVVLDTAPILPVTDGVVAARLADGVVLVAAKGQTTRADLQLAAAALAQVDRPVVGSVLNLSTTRSRSYGRRRGRGVLITAAPVKAPTPRAVGDVVEPVIDLRDESTPATDGSSPSANAGKANGARARGTANGTTNATTNTRAPVGTGPKATGKSKPRRRP
ncbi:MAG: polysaccharide biosynthesis tyrosine autokinase [Acidimicrobiia bacterium]